MGIRAASTIMKDSSHTDGLTVKERMLRLLSDGLPHTRQELHSCLNDDLGALSNIRAHISSIRQTLRRRGEDIVCELVTRRICYRHIRLLASAYDGRK